MHENSLFQQVLKYVNLLLLRVVIMTHSFGPPLRLQDGGWSSNKLMYNDKILKGSKGFLTEWCRAIQEFVILIKILMNNYY